MKKIAILILAHKNPLQCKRLISSLESDFFDIYLHIDKKTDIKQFEKELSEISNLYFTVNRVDTYLDNFSLVEATITLLKESFTKGKYMYYCLLTGQDYPIKSSSFIYKFLEISYPLNFIDAYPVNSMEWCAHYGQLRYSQEFRRKELNLLGRKIYESLVGKSIRLIFRIIENITTRIKGKPITFLYRHGYTLSTGSHFWMISDKLASFYIDEYKNEKINEIFKHIEVPEECYFQTILTKSELLNKQKNNPNIELLNPDIDGVDLPHYRYIKWFQNGVHSNGHPYIITTEDFENIRNAKALFARKFDIEIDDNIYDLIDKNILSKQ